MTKRNFCDPHEFTQCNTQIELNGKWGKHTLGLTKGVLWLSNSKDPLDRINDYLEGKNNNNNNNQT